MPIVTESNVQTKEFFQFKVLSNVRLCPRFCPRSNAPESARCLFTAFCKDNKLKAAHFDIFMMMPVVLLYNIQSFDYRGFLKLEVIDFAFIVMSLTRDEDRRGRRHQPVSDVSKVDLMNEHWAVRHVVFMCAGDELNATEERHFSLFISILPFLCH